MRKFKFVHPTDRMLIFILVMIIAMLVAIMGFLGWRIRQLERSVYCNDSQNSFNSSCIGFLPLSELVQGALKSLYSNQGVVDPTNNRVYFPEMKFYLPISFESRQLRYSYTAADTKNHQPEQAVFTNYSMLNHLVASLDEVPCFQRPVTVNIGDDSNTGGQKAGLVKLADGRTLYFSKTSNSACKDTWSTYIPQQIVDILKTAKSY